MKRFAALLSAIVIALPLMGCGSTSAAMIMLEDNQPPLSASPSPALPDHATPVPVSSPSPSPSAASDAALEACAAALATYPVGAVYPKEEDFLGQDGSFDFDAYNRAYEAWDAAQAAKPAVSADIARLNAFFRDGLAQFLSGGTENRACSPVNIYMALCMLAEVTDGQSRAQILHLLGADSMDALRKQANQLWNALYTDDGISTLLLGSSLWMNQSIRFREDTVKRLAESYYASSFSGNPGSPDFTAALRAWLKQQTRGLLEEQADNLSLDPDTVIALASTFYYKVPWQSSFVEAVTTPDVFHAPSGNLRTPYMHKTLYNSDFYAGNDFTAMPLSLAQGSMWLILPAEGGSVDSLLADGTVANLLSSPSSYVSAQGAMVELSLPKFDVSADMDLCEGLQGMGVKDVFDPDVSDFTPLTTDVERLQVSQIQHAARVKIDESGCEAAAYTVSKVELTAAMPGKPELITFTLDRPFLFVVAEGSLPLFAGVVNAPLAA